MEMAGMAFHQMAVEIMEGVVIQGLGGMEMLIPAVVQAQTVAETMATAETEITMAVMGIMAVMATMVMLEIMGIIRTITVGAMGMQISTAMAITQTIKTMETEM